MVETKDPVIHQVMVEEGQHHTTRARIFSRLEQLLKRPVVSYFTSFRHPVEIDDADADMLEGMLQKMDLTKGLVLIINSPGGDGLAAERIINVCRSYAGEGGYWVIVAGKAKSAATLVSFGASKIIMGPSSELGPVDPQLISEEDGVLKRYSVYNLVKSYEKLFGEAVTTGGNMEPFMLQLSKYDERDIAECKSHLALSEDIAIRALGSGMLKGISEPVIKEKIKVFLTPERTKIHGRPIYGKEAQGCGLNIELKGAQEPVWKAVYELYIRTDRYVSTRVSKCVENKNMSFVSVIPSAVRKDGGQKSENK